MSTKTALTALVIFFLLSRPELHYYYPDGYLFSYPVLKCGALESDAPWDTIGDICYRVIIFISVIFLGAYDARRCYGHVNYETYPAWLLISGLLASCFVGMYVKRRGSDRRTRILLTALFFFGPLLAWRATTVSVPRLVSTAFVASRSTVYESMESGTCVQDVDRADGVCSDHLYAGRSPYPTSVGSSLLETFGCCPLYKEKAETRVPGEIPQATYETDDNFSYWGWQ